jgi:hopanoid biosynthesis associated protein HpnK
MVAAPAAAQAVALAKRLPSLRVGLHVVLVEGRPVLPPSQIPALVDANGLFRANMAASGAKMFFLSDVRRQLAREIEAQFEAFRATGLALDHVNAHKHFHLHPTIAAAILRIGKKYGMGALRVPLEPGAGRLVGAFAGLLMNRVRREGIATPDRVYGLRWSGAMTKDRLLTLLRGLPDGLSEIYLHPATGPYPGSAPGYRYADELAALIDSDVVAATKIPAIPRGGFADFS